MNGIGDNQQVVIHHALPVVTAPSPPLNWHCRSSWSRRRQELTGVASVPGAATSAVLGEPPPVNSRHQHPSNTWSIQPKQIIMEMQISGSVMEYCGEYGLPEDLDAWGGDIDPARVRGGTWAFSCGDRRRVAVVGTFCGKEKICMGVCDGKENEPRVNCENWRDPQSGGRFPHCFTRSYL